MEQLVRLVEALGLFGLFTVGMFGCGAIAIVCQAWVDVNKRRMRHAERIAAIQRGMDPKQIEEVTKQAS